MSCRIVLLILVILLAGVVVFSAGVRKVEASGTIYIRADGSIDPPTSLISTTDNVTYTLTGDISDSIMIERDNVVCDGSGYAVQGTGASDSRGIDLSGRSNVTFQNTNVKNFSHGIWLSSSSNHNIISRNTITDNSFGIWLYSSASNSISGNTITDGYYGICLDSSANNNISGNSLTNNNVGIWLYSSSNNNVSGNAFTDGGFAVLDSYANRVENNTVNGKPLVYLEGVADYSVEDAGQVVLVKCDRIRVESLSLSRTYVGVELWETNNSIISGNTITATSWIGIWLYSSSNNSVSGNNITANNRHGILLDGSSSNSISGNTITDGYYGIWLASCSNNSISGNNITANGHLGINLDYSSNNSISGNNITNNSGAGIEFNLSYDNSIAGNNITNNKTHGIALYSCSNNSMIENNMANNYYGAIRLDYSSNNSVGVNNITNNYDGIDLYFSSNNSISGNNIANNDEGIWLRYSSNNSVCHNNFVNNIQVRIDVSTNVWDDGYPSGGNYWSNYTGLDLDHDGIGNTAHVIDENNTDNYPLMGMFSEFNVTYFTPPLVTHSCNVTVISNSTVSDFEAPIWIEHPEVIFLKFNVTGAEGSAGFCRVYFPTAMMNSTYHVYVSGIEVPCILLPCSSADYSYLYFTYAHSTKEVVIIPEFPTFFIIPLFMMATLLVAIVFQKCTPIYAEQRRR